MEWKERPLTYREAIEGGFIKPEEVEKTDLDQLSDIVVRETKSK